jgi:ABC-type transport system involved in cytochrome c biogenesis ATPase subunit
MSNKVDITIKGPTGSGKTALMFLIKGFLEDQCGLDVSFGDPKETESEAARVDSWHDEMLMYTPEVTLHEELDN